MFRELEKILEYNFTNTELVREALTHPSTSFGTKKNNRFNYERLEILGDSVLSFIIMEYLFKKHPKETEGELSKRKALLISKNTLCIIAKQLNLGKFIILTIGEENCGGRENVNNLENVLEALIGAIFLDSNLDNVKKFVISRWKYFDDREIKAPIDPKTELQNWTQKHFKKTPEYIVDKVESGGLYFSVELKIPNHAPIKESGKSLKEIKEKLAADMLSIIKKP
jgi:ribonuclease III